MAVPEQLPAPEEIRALRKAMGWTQRDVAMLLDVTETTVRRWESGVNEIPLSSWKGLLWARQEEQQRRRQAEGEAPERPAVAVPLVGEVCAGVGVLVDEDREGEVHVDAEEVPRGTIYAVRVRGESMAPTIPDGALVFVDRYAEPSLGDFVIATVPQEGTVLRQLVERDGGLDLAALAEGYPPYPRHGHEVELQGVVVGFSVRLKPGR